MSKTNRIGGLVASALLALPLAARADAGHEHQAESGHAGMHEHTGSDAAPAGGLAAAWAAVMAARNAVAADVANGALAEVHEQAEPLPELLAELIERSSALAADRRARVEGAAHQVARVADALHDAADRGDAARTKKELGRLDRLLELIRAQYPSGALGSDANGPDGHSSAPWGAHAAHAGMAPPAGVVDVAARATVRIRAFDQLRFEPQRIEVTAGRPTRIELENAGAAEHSLVVRTPGGGRDWVHLHVQPGGSDAATYRLDVPGTYPVYCALPGHAEGGMTGELVVRAGTPGAESRP